MDRFLGEVVRVDPCGTPYRAVLHAVAIDAFYETSAEIVRDVVRRSLDLAASESAERVLLAALATGYGKLGLREFGEALEPLAGMSASTVREVRICVTRPGEADEIAAGFVSARLI